MLRPTLSPGLAKSTREWCISTVNTLHKSTSKHKHIRSNSNNSNSNSNVIVISTTIIIVIVRMIIIIIMINLAGARVGGGVGGQEDHLLAGLHDALLDAAREDIADALDRRHSWLPCDKHPCLLLSPYSTPL